ncbi:MAG: hypothetical protein JOY78_18745 [Pseudonocardia sp.]|nr:hypothetical protein [Pseudonocardia sp.]
MSSNDDRLESRTAPATGPAPTALSVGAAIRYGWERFKANPWTWIGAVVIAAVIQGVLNGLFGNRSTFRVDTFGQSFWTVGWIVGSIVTTVVGYLINAAFVRGALHEVDGRRPGLGAFFRFTNVGNVILASVLVGVMTAVGLILLVIPGLIVAFLSWWTLQFVIDRDDSAVEGIRASFRCISSQAGTLFLLALALIGINIVGAIPFGLGLLITVPLSTIASTYAYRVVSGRGVAHSTV